MLFAGPAVVGEETGAMVKFAEVTVAPIDVLEGAPAELVEAPAVGPPVVVLDNTLLLLLGAAADGAPVTTGAEVAPVTITVAAAVFALVSQMASVLNVGPLVAAL